MRPTVVPIRFPQMNRVISCYFCVILLNSCACSQSQCEHWEYMGPNGCEQCGGFVTKNTQNVEVCNACPSGTFGIGGNTVMSCVCFGGRKTTHVGNSVTCEDCEIGTRIHLNRKLCVPCTETVDVVPNFGCMCKAGEEGKPNAACSLCALNHFKSATSNRLCEECQMGKHRNDNRQECRLCPVGKTTNDTTGNCVPHAGCASMALPTNVTISGYAYISDMHLSGSIQISVPAIPATFGQQQRVERCAALCDQNPTCRIFQVTDTSGNVRCNLLAPEIYFSQQTQAERYRDTTNSPADNFYAVYKKCTNICASNSIYSEVSKKCEPCPSSYSASALSTAFDNQVSPTVGCIEFSFQNNE